MNSYSSVLDSTQDHSIETSLSFYNDVIRGLSALPKRLDSKYFYDANGDRLFQQIMHSPEYYPTDCELEIFSKQTSKLTLAITSQLKNFDLVELGSGDAYKSSYLLANLLSKRIDFRYLPIDISENVIALLTRTLPESMPGLDLLGLNGEYFAMLEIANKLSQKIN